MYASQHREGPVSRMVVTDHPGSTVAHDECHENTYSIRFRGATVEFRHGPRSLVTQAPQGVGVPSGGSGVATPGPPPPPRSVRRRWRRLPRVGHQPLEVGLELIGDHVHLGRVRLLRVRASLHRRLAAEIELVLVPSSSVAIASPSAYPVRTVIGLCLVIHAARRLELAHARGQAGERRAIGRIARPVARPSCRPAFDPHRLVGHTQLQCGDLRIVKGKICGCWRGSRRRRSVGVGGWVGPMLNLSRPTTRTARIAAATRKPRVTR